MDVEDGVYSFFDELGRSLVPRFTEASANEIARDIDAGFSAGRFSNPLKRGLKVLVMKRLSLPIFIGILLTVVFFVLQAFGGGMCHCSRPLQYFFPFVSMLGVHADWGVLAILLLGLQFPAYAVCVTLARGPNWKARVLLILFAVHACAVWVAIKIFR